MTSIFSFLRIPIKLRLDPILSSSSLQIVNSTKTFKSEKRANQPVSLGVTTYVLKSFQEHKTLFGYGHEIRRLSVTPETYRTIQRCFCKKHSAKKHKSSRQINPAEKSKKDDVCGEDCITVREDKLKKKIKKDTQLKFVVNLNNIIHDAVKNRACRKLEQINKLNNFIFRPINCTSCMQKKNVTPNDKMYQQRRSYSISTIKRKLLTKVYFKKSELNCLKTRLKTDSIVNPFVGLKTSGNQKNIMLVKDVCEVSNGGIVPLYLLVKNNSRKTKATPNVAKHFQYRVGTNQAFVPLERKGRFLETMAHESKRYILSSTTSNDSFFTEKCPLAFTDAESRKAKSITKAKFEECFLKPRDETRNGSRDHEFNSTLAEVVTKVLTPLLQKEQSKYFEVKKAIDRLEKKIECYLEKQNAIPDENLCKTLSTIYSHLIRQSQLSLNIAEIKDPLKNVEYKDPIKSSEYKKDPVTRGYNITLPSLANFQIKEPYTRHAVIAKDCDEKNNKNRKGKNNFNNKEDACDKLQNSIKKENVTKDVKCDEKQTKKENSKAKCVNDVCKYISKKLPNIGFTSKPSTICEKSEPCRNDIPKCKNEKPPTCANESFKPKDCEPACFETANNRATEIYKPKNPSKNQLVEVAEPCPNVGKPTDPCKSPRSRSTDPCKSPPRRYEINEMLIHKSQFECDTKTKTVCEEKKPMCPSEVTCPQNESYIPKPCCQNNICEKNTLNMLEPKCNTDQPSPSQDISQHKSQVCDQVPMPSDCRMKLDMENKKPKGLYVPTPVQKPCHEIGHESTEPSNCCKPKPTVQPCSGTLFTYQKNISEKPGRQQTPCSPPKTSEQKKLETEEQDCKYQSSLPNRPITSAPKEAFINYNKLQDESCQSTINKEISKKSEEKIHSKRKVSNGSDDKQWKYHRSREPQQAQKKNWIPIKIQKPQIRKCKSQPTTTCSPAESHPEKDNEILRRTPPKLTEKLPSKTTDQKATTDSCKGFLKSICKIFCPGKGNHKKKADSLVRSQSSPSLPQGRIELPCCILPGSSDNNGSKKQIHTLFANNTRVKEKYPWKREEQQTSRCYRKYSSNCSNEIVIFPSKGQFIKAKRSELHRNIVKKSKRKTLTFRLAIFKQMNAFGTNNVINRIVLLHPDVLSQQKRKFSECRDDNKVSNSKTDISTGMKRKLRDKNKYPWKKPKTDTVYNSYECYLTKKSLEHAAEINDETDEVLNELGFFRAKKEEDSKKFKSCDTVELTKEAATCGNQSPQIEQHSNCLSSKRETEKSCNETECFVPKTEEEKKKYKSCDTEKSSKDQCVLTSTAGKSCNEVECFIPRTEEEKKKYKSCDAEKCLKVDGNQSSLLDAKDKKINEPECVRLKTESEKLKDKSCDAGESAPEDPCAKPIFKKDLINGRFNKCLKENDGNQTKTNDHCSKKAGGEKLSNSKSIQQEKKNDKSCNDKTVTKCVTPKIAAENETTMVVNTMENKLNPEEKQLKFSENCQLTNENTNEKIKLVGAEKNRIPGEGEQSINADPQSINLITPHKISKTSIDDAKELNNKTTPTEHYQSTDLSTKQKAQSKTRVVNIENNIFDQIHKTKTDVKKRMYYFKKNNTAGNMRNVESSKKTGTLFFKLLKNNQEIKNLCTKRKDAATQSNQFEGLACIIEIPLTKDGIKQRAEIRISCEGLDQSIQKEGGKKNLSIVKRPSEIAEIKKVLESLASSTDQEIIYGKCIKSGKSEIIICKTKEQWEDVKIEDENLNNLSRIIQGKVIKDKCSKDILVCQELKTTNCNDSPEDVEKYMKDLIRSAKIAPISTSVEVLVCNKLVCFDKKVHDTDKRELECRVLQVKELLGHTEPSTAHVKNSLDQAVSDESGTENTK